MAYDELLKIYNAGKIESDRRGRFVWYDGFKWNVGMYEGKVIFTKRLPKY